MTGPDRDVDLLTGAYALDALTDDERRQLEERLASSEALRNEVTEFSDTAVLLGLAVTPEMPRASAKAELLARLDATPQEGASDAPSAPSLEDDDNAEISPLHPVTSGLRTSDEVRPGSAESRARSRWFRGPVQALVGAAAAVAIIAGGFFALQPGSAGGQKAAFDRIVAASDSRSDTKGIVGGGEATVHWSNELASSALVVDGLAEPESGTTYELWYIDDAGNTTPAGLFSPDNGTHTAVLDGSLKPGDTVGVTVEPASGSTSPTTDPIIAIQTAA